MQRILGDLQHTGDLTQLYRQRIQGGGHFLILLGQAGNLAGLRVYLLGQGSDFR